MKESIRASIITIKVGEEDMEKNGKTKAYDVKEIRQKYPKAYMRWTEDEDNALRNSYLRGKSIDELASIFQRKPSAIRSRLKKLGLLSQCRIFKDPEMNKRIESDPENIITLGVYSPKYGRAYEDMDEFSQMILDIKKDERRIYPQSREYYYYKKAINYFTNRLHSILSDRDKYVICVYPTSREGIAFTGMRTIAKRLCEYSSQRIDGTDVLSRAFEIPKKAIGGVRDLQEEIRSLTVRNKNIIKNQQVLLMDDITTTGTSLKAGKIVLKRAGAKIVALLALGKTQSDNKYYE